MNMRWPLFFYALDGCNTLLEAGLLLTCYGHICNLLEANFQPVGSTLLTCYFHGGIAGPFCVGSVEWNQAKAGGYKKGQSPVWGPAFPFVVGIVNLFLEIAVV